MATKHNLSSKIQAEIERGIVTGKWAPGERIPSELELTLQFACSRMTVNKALTQLSRSGMITRKRRLGSFVATQPSRSAVLMIQDIRSEVTALGLAYRFEVQQRKRRTSLPSDGLEVSKPVAVLQIAVLHFAADKPFCYEQRVINLQAVPQAAQQSFQEFSPGTWLMREVPWTSAQHRISAQAADAECARKLKLSRGAACLVMERCTWHANQPVTRVRFVYPGQGHELLAHFSPSSMQAAD